MTGLTVDPDSVLDAINAFNTLRQAVFELCQEERPDYSVLHNGGSGPDCVESIAVDEFDRVAVVLAVWDNELDYGEEEQWLRFTFSKNSVAARLDNLRFN